MAEFLNLAGNEQTIKDAFRQTYFISQGDIRLQRNLFEWLAIKNKIPLEEYRSIKTDWLSDFTSPVLHDPAGYKDTILQKKDPSSQWKLFMGSLIDHAIHSDTTPLELNYKIFTLLTAIDLEYQIFKRPNRPIIQAEPDSKQDQHKSFLRHYILNDYYKAEPFGTLFNELKIYIPQPQSFIVQIDMKKLGVPEVKNKDRKNDTEGEVSDWVNTLNVYEAMSLLVKLWEKNHQGHKFFGE